MNPDLKFQNNFEVPMIEYQLDRMTGTKIDTIAYISYQSLYEIFGCKKNMTTRRRKRNKMKYQRITDCPSKSNGSKQECTGNIDAMLNTTKYNSKLFIIDGKLETFYLPGIKNVLLKAIMVMKICINP
jgi:hypothetical protein